MSDLALLENELLVFLIQKTPPQTKMQDRTCGSVEDWAAHRVRLVVAGNCPYCVLHTYFRDATPRERARLVALVDEIDPISRDRAATRRQANV